MQEASTTRHSQRLHFKTFPGILDILVRYEVVQRKEFTGFGIYRQKCFPTGNKSMITSQALLCQLLETRESIAKYYMNYIHCIYPEEKTSDIVTKPQLTQSKQRSMISFPILKSFITREWNGRNQWFDK